MLPRGNNFPARIRRGESSPALEERSAFQTQGKEAAPAQVQREKAGQAEPGWNAEDVKRGVRSGAGSQGR